jgi:predicted PhzF superfamily epimerase YddE/YHI9
VIFEHIESGRQQVVFHTRKAGALTVERQGDWFSMDFPARPARPVAAMPVLDAALGAAPKELLLARDHMAVYGSTADVLALNPDFAALAKLDCWAVIATAPGKNGVDFVSRFFGPAQGIDEDPATGSSHCTLIPYWANRLGKSQLLAHQVSRRSGMLKCKSLGDRVNIAGKAVLYMEGEIALA